MAKPSPAPTPSIVPTPSIPPYFAPPTLATTPQMVPPPKTSGVSGTAEPGTQLAPPGTSESGMDYFLYYMKIF